MENHSEDTHICTLSILSEYGNNIHVYKIVCLPFYVFIKLIDTKEMTFKAFWKAKLVNAYL
jgi:hypothetical protein